MTTVSASELAALVSRQGRKLTTTQVQLFLTEWQERRIVEQSLPGRFRLTATGRAMFAGAFDELDLEKAA